VSHIVQIQTQVRDPAAVRAACERLKIPAPTEGKFRLYATRAEGLGVQLPGWRYPIVCNPATGEVKFDNFGGHWGKQQELDGFMQAYAVEKAKIEARRQGHSVVEQPLSDGSIKLTVQVSGGTA
jgi:hypothetical protein